MDIRMKMFKKSLSVLLAAIMLFSFAAFAFAADGSVKLRVEGIDKCFFYGDVEIEDGATVQQLFEAAAAKDKSFTFTVEDSDYGPYLTAINGLAAGTKTEKMWDGWQYTINGVDGFSFSTDTVKNGDSVLFYYSDQWGETGFYFPEIDTSELDSEGKLYFTITETVYADDGTPSQEKTRLKDYTLIWDGKKIKSEKDGAAKIPFSSLKSGSHSVQIEKYASNGLPLVLRFEPDFTVNTDMGMGNLKIVLVFFRRMISLVSSVLGK